LKETSKTKQDMYDTCGIELLADDSGATEADAANCRAWLRGESTERFRRPVQVTVAAAVDDFLEVCAPDLSVTTYRRRPLKPLPKPAAPREPREMTFEERVARTAEEDQREREFMASGEDRIAMSRDPRWTDGPPLVVQGIHTSAGIEPVPMDHRSLKPGFNIRCARPATQRDRSADGPSQTAFRPLT
jgi:hypothetical protein